jgi:ABC-type nitrate/sulfonate/bicarbonate transport system substrate-binding protein
MLRQGRSVYVRRSILGLAAVVALLATACGSSSKNSSTSSNTTASSGTSAATTPATTGAAGAAPASSGAGPGTPAPKPLAQPTSVTIAITAPAEFVSPIYLANTFGEFQKENLHVTITDLNFTDALVLMQQGKVQMLAGGATAGMLNADASGQTFKQVGAIFDNEPSSKLGLYVRDQYLTPQGTLNCADVPKMTFNYSTGGLGSSIPFVAQEVLNKCGYSLTQVKHVALDSAESLPALENGAISFSYLNDPQAGEAYTGNFAKLLAGTAYSLASYMMSTKYLDSNPTTAAAILRALMRTERTYFAGDYHSNPTTMSAIEKFTGAPASKILADAPLYFKPDMQFSTAADNAILGIQKIWIQNKIVDYTTPLTLPQINDTTLAAQVSAGQA